MRQTHPMVVSAKPSMSDVSLHLTSSALRPSHDSVPNDGRAVGEGKCGGFQLFVVASVGLESVARDPAVDQFLRLPHAFPRRQY